MDPADITNRFAYHPPVGRKTGDHEYVRQVFMALALELNARLPDCRETSLLMTHLEEGMFWANAAIARLDEDGTRR